MAATSGMNGSASSTEIKNYQQLCLDEERKSLTLLSIVRAFNEPINEERAWAILYQATKTALNCYLSKDSSVSEQKPIISNPISVSCEGETLLMNSSVVPNDTGQDLAYPIHEIFKCCVVSEASQLWIHHEGQVHPLSFMIPIHDMKDRTLANTEGQLVAGLGWVLFEALDFGLKKDEELALSPDLEQMIDSMTSAYSDTESQSVEDEGIVGDSSETSNSSSRAESPDNGTQEQASGTNLDSTIILSLNKILERCRMQVSSTASDLQADNHFRAVCRALVAETLEFSDFLVKVSAAPDEWRELRNKAEPEHTTDLVELHLADWAKLWVQVIRQLRNGVKLKSINERAHKPVEFEMTPYEMMMDDIRSRRYKLKQVEGKIPPRVKKDAHAVILEFIRSRPPLRKASERRLRPARKTATPVEMLMESIRKHDSAHLRPTRSLMRVRSEVSASRWVSIAPRRKVLRADQFNPDAEENDDDDDPLAQIPPASPPIYRFGNLTISLDKPSVIKSTSSDASGTSSKPRISTSGRQNLVVAPPQLSRTKSAPSVKASALKLSSLSVPDPRIALQPGHLSSSAVTSSLRSSLSAAALPSPPVSPMLGGSTSRDLQDDFVRSEEFQQVAHGKLVTLEELVHMRRVLTAASLEALPSKSSVKEDVMNGKLCFACRKTRFSVFGAWRHGCKLCTMTVCTKCCSKMLIPSDRFDTVSVSELTLPEKHQQYVSHSACSSPLPSTSLFSGFHLKLPQFLVHSPKHISLAPPSGLFNGSRSTPTSPLLSRHESLKQGHSQAAVAHQALSKHQSLSTHNTPIKSRKNDKKSFGLEGYVCRECQSLIDHINHNRLPTLHLQHNFMYQSLGMEPCSLP